MTTFRTVLISQGNNVGIEVPEEVVLGFGAGKRVPVSKAVREAAGMAGGETHDVRSKEHVRSVSEAKAPETRARRVQKVVDSLTS